MYKVRTLGRYRSISEIFSLFYLEKDAVILESSLINSLGKYSIIGRKPYHKIVKDGEHTFVNDKKIEEDFDSYVKAYFKANQSENPTNLPIISGAIGYFSYDYNRNVDCTIPESILIFYDEFIIEDHQNQTIYLVANGKTSDALSAVDELKSKIESMNNISDVDSEKYSPTVKFDFEKEEYLKAINKMIHYIIEGDIYIANMTQQLFIESAISPYQLYCRLRKNNPSPFAVYANYYGFQIISASPERFIRVKNNEILTRPIKGTRKRGDTFEEDHRMKMELESSEKDKSELLMIVDLERNDLSKICKPGSVEVDNLYSIESYATVHHLVADVKGVLKEQVDIIDIIDAAFPGGSITGAPKIRAMEIIEELEKNHRGLYTGSIGYFSLNGDCDMNIVIRTAVHMAGSYNLGVGGGITFESEEVAEYEETLQKAKAIVEALH